MSSGEPNLVLTFVGQIFNFIVLLILLKIFVFKPFFNLLNERRAKIQKGIEKEAEAEEKFQSLKGVEHKMKERNEKDRRAVLAEAEESAKERTDKTIQALNEVKKEVLLKAEADAENIKKQKEEETKKEIIDHSIFLTKKILGEKIDLSQDKELINSYLNNLK